MVSGVKVWDPLLHAGPIRSRPSERHPASGLAPPCALVHRVAKDAPRRQSQRPTPSSSSPPSTRGSAEAFPPPAGSNRAEPETRRPGMKGKRHGGRGDAAMEDRLESASDGPRNAKITLSFPASAGPLPASLTSSGYCRNGASSSSPHRRRPSSKSSDGGSLWKLDSTTDIKHRPFKPARRDGSPSSPPSSSSSSSPMTAHALMAAGKDIKSPPPPPPPLKCSKVSPETHFARSEPGWDERRGSVNGTASPSQTAQILFSLGAAAAAYQRGGGEAERKEKTTGRAAAKLGSPHGPGLHPPPLHLPPPLPPPPPPPPPPSEGLGAPPLPRPASYSPGESAEPELICGVCRRLFSSAASLTVHMRLHRGSRALGCRFCGKVFIHGKRLHSHEASCGAPGPPPGPPGPPLAVRPKEEPLEEGEVRAGEGQQTGDGDAAAAAAAAAELPAGDRSHFVKVVDGNVIYFCSVCERSYMTLSSLKRHSNVHSWRRRYPCRFCDKVFALAEYRTKHEVWHTGERRYQCIFCWDAFATYYNLKTHQKAIHGISPGLISSEKTANGGYKQKADALKLYRLLPMRSQKRPYKTYSHSLHRALMMSPTEAPPHPLGCALGPADLQSFIGGGGARPQSVKPDPDGFFSGDVPAADGERAPPPPSSPPPSFPRPRKHDGEPVPGTSASCKTKSHHRAAGAADPSGAPSVITYGHPKPSVIVHGTAVSSSSSSVIVHSKQVAPGSEPNELAAAAIDVDVDVGQRSHKGGSRSCKRQRDCADGHRKRARDNSEAASRKRSRGKNEPSESPPPPPSPLAASSPVIKETTGPLCQITVRIGEEAIVKRSISETDLRRDKSRSPPKAKKGPAASSAKAARHPRKRHVHRRASQRGREADAAAAGASKEQAGQSAGNSSDELREYNFRRKVREQESDHDTEDNLWRPYYSYKPKKKAQAHLQRFKSWQRKLKFKRALRLKRRAERRKKRGGGGGSHDDDEDDDGEEEESGKPSGADERGCARDAKRAEFAAALPPSPKPPPPPLAAAAAAPSGPKRRPSWSAGNVAECATCGCWFSSSGKRDQHELSHLLEFVCLFCRAAFPSRDKLEDHQRIQHPKPADTSPTLQKTPLAEQGDAAKPEKELSQVDSSPARLSRRALSRHTCPQCHKVCKTSSALGRHLRRHEVAASPGREKEEDVRRPDAAAAGGDAPPPKGQVVSVISYSTADPPKSAAESSPSPVEPTTTQRRQDGPEAAERAHPEPESRSGPEMNESPVNLTPAKARLAPPATPPPLQSVLVMNRPECLDYRTPGKRSLDGLASPARGVAAPDASSDAPEAPQTRITAAAAAAAAAAPPVSMATLHGANRGFVTRDGVIMDRERQARGAMFAHAGFKGPPSLQDLQVQSRSRSTSPGEAQDLTMSSIRAREREMERQTLRKRELEKRRERGKDKDRGKDAEGGQRPRRPEQTPPADPTALLVPKEEPLSPVPSPQHVPCQSQTVTNGPPSRRHAAKSPCRPALLANQQAQELDRLTLPTGGVGDRPSAHALLLPRPPKAPEPERRETLRRVEPAPACYPHQDYPLPLIAPDNYRPAKKQQDQLLVSSYPTGALPFGPLGKMMVPNGADLAKLPFYPDPYQLLYGSQLLAYPYNMAALPVALNMMAPGADKVEPLPFLPAIFNYAAAGGAGPYVGAAAPHPLVANPSFYGGGKKQRDGGSHKP